MALRTVMQFQPNRFAAVIKVFLLVLHARASTIVERQQGELQGAGPWTYLPVPAPP
ncbi:hypothetical protein Daesc_001522 [Daldinia eschscholtzii]|uniref:Secreted protein n=1 Tax=Daldinia eschscholtzii TaxID=292717 RepID=A0AAX6MUC5_9PEZI